MTLVQGLQKARLPVADDRIGRVAVCAALLLGIAAPAWAQLFKRVHATGLSSPVAFVQDPTDPAIQFVVQQGGRIRVLRNGALLAQDFLDLTGDGGHSDR